MWGLREPRPVQTRRPCESAASGSSWQPMVLAAFIHAQTFAHALGYKEDIQVRIYSLKVAKRYSSRKRTISGNGERTSGRYACVMASLTVTVLAPSVPAWQLRTTVWERVMTEPMLQLIAPPA
eukprot:6194468-Pleurochrysis_carterae.AAC.1